ncbi:MAG: single-stranded DNA-binding protein [archaeon]
MDKIGELRPFQKRVELTVKVLEKNEVREVTSKLDNSSHKVTEVLIGDESGTILLTLWDDMIEKVELEKSYKIANGYTSLFKNSLRMNIGRYGELNDSEEEVADIKKDNNVSDKEFEQRPRRFGDRGGGGNRGGGFNRRGSFDRPRKSFDSQDSNAGSDDSDAGSSDDSFDSDE